MNKYDASIFMEQMENYISARISFARLEQAYEHDPDALPFDSALEITKRLSFHQKQLIEILERN